MMSIFDHILSGFDGNKSNQQPLSIDVLRPHIIGTDSMIKTPYGERIVTYADYTASGRGLEFIENYMMDLQRLYANTHTEDDTTGRTTSALFHQAENSIKKSVGATDDDCVITCGDGATAAIYRLQQILGVAIPPSTFARMKEQMKCAVSNEDYQAIENQMDKTGPVVFVGPFEHHSNEVSWRSSLATVVEIELDDEGNIDLVQLEKELQ
ncbi:MAG: aminotransferase class V-fold PLP-dependent enzyme, partial [Kordiimonadaceae bacterium]|nr:aminotransferase class V-fold PLP-dependent enzyme [Kordiimonadaceae bacterium]